MIDAGDFAGLSALFTRATLRTEGFDDVRRGAAEVRALYEGMVKLYDGKPSTQHVTTNIAIEVDDDALTATARSAYTVLQATAELPLHVVIAGRYADTFSRDASGWYFTERVISLGLMGNLSAHLKMEF